MVKVYLAGRAFETTYRKQVKREYGSKFKLIDPMIENGVFVDTKNMKIQHNGATVESILKMINILFVLVIY